MTFLLWASCQGKLETLPQELTTLCHGVVQQLTALAAELKELLAKSKFMVAGKDLDFNNLYLFTLNQVQEKNPEAKSILSTVWINVFNHVKSYNPALFFAIKDKLREAEVAFLAGKLGALGVIKPAEKYSLLEMRSNLIETCRTSFFK